MYQVIYFKDGCLHTYCGCNMPLDIAKVYLAKFKDNYLNQDGSGKPYPNGKGFYAFTNPQIVLSALL